MLKKRRILLAGRKSLNLFVVGNGFAVVFLTAIPYLTDFPSDAMQCREKWSNVLDPFLNRGEYSAEEDELIMKLCEERGSNTDDSCFWSKIAQSFRNRTDNQIYRRWTMLVGNSYKFLLRFKANEKIY